MTILSDLMNSDTTWSVYTYATLWSLLWIILLVLPPGSKAINSAYRLNFVHGVLSSGMYIYLHIYNALFTYI